MKELQKFLIYLVASIVIGALLAPPLFWAGQHFHFLQRFEFQKFFNRAVLISALVLLWPLIKWVRIPDRKCLGLGADSHFLQRLGIGFLASFVLMIALGFILIELEIYRFKPAVPWGALGKILVTAAVVSAIEEFLFRGAILGLLARSSSRRAAMAVSSALFAIVHFLHPKEGVISSESVTWWSGFRLALEAFWQFSEPMLVLAGFTTLFAVGWVLAYSRLRTGSLWMAIGLHAGWIVGTMGFSKMTKRLVRETLPWFGSDLSVGIGAVIMVVLTGILVWLWFKYGDPETRQGSR